MGNQDLAAAPDGVEASYQVVSLPGCELPASVEGFVYANWLKTYKYGGEFLRYAEKDAYFSSSKRRISQLLSARDCILRLATLHDDRDVLLGFSLATTGALHYVFVPYLYRQQGIAKSLIPKGIWRISHLSKPGLGLWRSCLPNASYIPFFIEE